MILSQLLIYVPPTIRGGMVQTAEQYEYIHRVLALYEATLPMSASDWRRASSTRLLVCNIGPLEPPAQFSSSNSNQQQQQQPDEREQHTDSESLMRSRQSKRSYTCMNPLRKKKSCENLPVGGGGGSNKERDLEVKCCSETGTAYVTTTSTNIARGYSDCTNVIVNRIDSSTFSNQIVDHEIESLSNFNSHCNNRCSSDMGPSPTYATGESDYQSNSRNHTPETCLQSASGGCGGSVSPIMRGFATGMTSPPNIPCNSNSQLGMCSVVNGNVERSHHSSRDSLRSSDSLSSPESKRQRTMLEKTCAIWDGFEPLKPYRQLTVSEWRQQSRF